MKKRYTTAPRRIRTLQSKKDVNRCVSETAQGTMYQFQQEQVISAPIEEVFAFFSNAQNLERLTPDLLGFEIKTPTPIKMKEGTLIDYSLKIHGIPMKWKTLISEWRPPLSFTDEQIRGPYQTWIHRHTFESIDNGKATIMKDHIQYKIFMGPFVHWLVKRDIEQIFQHRHKVIASVFDK